MKVGNVFARVGFANLTILQPNGAWVRAVIESSFNPITTQDVVPVFAYFVAKQFRDEYPIRAILGLKTQDGAFERSLRHIFNLLKGSLGKMNYVSKISCSFRVQSLIPS